MKTMLLTSPSDISQSPLRLTEIAMPKPAEGQIRIKINACGVCHTDLHTVEGELALPKLPLIPGHQIVGRVEKSGRQTNRHNIGDRVGIAWLNWACGECLYCRNGKENLCRKARFTGLHADGGYAEYVVVDERFAYRLPDIFSDLEAAPLLCAGVIGYRALRLSEIKPGEKLGLYGFGASAHLALQVARHWNCEVYVFTRGQVHRRLAEDLGASWTGGADDHPPRELDSAIIFAPVGDLIPKALRHLRPGGTLAINAIYMSPIPLMEYPLIYEERTLRSVAHVARQDAEDFLPLAGKIGLKITVQEFPLEEANRALALLKKSELRGSAALHIS